MKYNTQIKYLYFKVGTNKLIPSINTLSRISILNERIRKENRAGNRYGNGNQIFGHSSDQKAIPPILCAGTGLHRVGLNWS